MPEMRFTIPEKLDNIILKIADAMGVDKSDYVKSLILNDLRSKNFYRGEHEQE